MPQDKVTINTAITYYNTVYTDIDVAVGCLTCYGALLSLTNPHREVEIWLKEETPTGWPWIVQHCVQLLEYDSKYMSEVYGTDGVFVVYP